MKSPTNIKNSIELAKITFKYSDFIQTRFLLTTDD